MMLERSSMHFAKEESESSRKKRNEIVKKFSTANSTFAITLIYLKKVQIHTRVSC